MIKFIKDQIEEEVKDKITTYCDNCGKTLKLNRPTEVSWILNNMFTYVYPEPCTDCYKRR